MKTKVLVLFAIFFSCSFIEAQTDISPGPIQPDRPGLGESSQIVPERYLQIESGMNLEFDENNRNLSWNNLTVRWGIFREFELRFAINLEQTYSNGARGKLAVSPFSIGFKAHVSDQKGLVPSTALLGNLGIPYLSSDTTTPFVSPSLLIPMEWDLSDKLLLTVNNGLFWNGSDATPEYFAALGLDLALPRETGLFIEGYMSMTEAADWTPGFNGGFIWRVRPNFQLDCSAGLGLNNNAADGFINAGISYRLPK